MKTEIVANGGKRKRDPNNKVVPTIKQQMSLNFGGVGFDRYNAKDMTNAELDTLFNESKATREQFKVAGLEPASGMPHNVGKCMHDQAQGKPGGRHVSHCNLCHRGVFAAAYTFAGNVIHLARHFHT